MYMDDRYFIRRKDLRKVWILYPIRYSYCNEAVGIRVYSTRGTSVCAKDSDSLAPTPKWGPPFILEWSELYELLPELYEPLIGARWLQETSGRPVKLRVVWLANLRLTAATALQPSFYFGSSRSGYMFTTFPGLYLDYIKTKFGLH